MDNKEYSDKGAFRFYFWVKSGWYGVNVDDRLPSRSWGSGFRPTFTWVSKQGAWWMPLLEKAYAKLDQNYDRIIGGNGDEGLRTLTGMPTQMIGLFRTGRNPALKEELFKIHKYWASQNYPSTAACCRAPTYGLIRGHAYSLLDVAELKEGDKVVHRLAKLRNPWNSEHYKGPWRDDDPNWEKHPDWKKQVDLKPSNDGIFWMPYDLFVTRYYYSTVALYQPYKFKVTNFKLGPRGDLLYSIDNPKDQYFYVTVEGYSYRHYPRASKCRASW